MQQILKDVYCKMLKNSFGYASKQYAQGSSKSDVAL